MLSFYSEAKLRIKSLKQFCGGARIPAQVALTSEAKLIIPFSLPLFFLFSFLSFLPIFFLLFPSLLFIFLLKILLLFVCFFN